ncbi:hypothetical protein OG864_00910 [Streptomyces sp. NBC_00124]|nr:hypothetical protein [Streptomyces sp. NBC_00124]MCX5357340.1 hypothetical protein [Streptomyces sp. NBC_00124]
MPEDQLSTDQPADASEEADEAVVDDIDPGFAPDWQPTAGEYRLTTR